MAIPEKLKILFLMHSLPRGATRHLLRESFPVQKEQHLRILPPDRSQHSVPCGRSLAKLSLSNCTGSCLGSCHTPCPSLPCPSMLTAEVTHLNPLALPPHPAIQAGSYRLAGATLRAQELLAGLKLHQIALFMCQQVSQSNSFP